MESLVFLRRVLQVERILVFEADQVARGVNGWKLSLRKVNFTVALAQVRQQKHVVALRAVNHHRIIVHMVHTFFVVDK